MHDAESAVTFTYSPVPSIANPMLSVTSCSHTQPREALPSSSYLPTRKAMPSSSYLPTRRAMPPSSYLPTQTITPQLSTDSSTISAPRLIDTETTSYSIKSNVSSTSSLASNIPPVESTANTVPNNIHSTPSSSKMDPAGTSSDTVQTPHKAMSQPSVSTIPKPHSRQHRNRVQQISTTKPKSQSRR